MKVSMKRKLLAVKASFLCLLLTLYPPPPVKGQVEGEQGQQDLGPRHICPEAVFRRYGRCEPQEVGGYKRVAKHRNSGAVPRRRDQEAAQHRRKGQESKAPKQQAKNKISPADNDASSTSAQSAKTNSKQDKRAQDGQAELNAPSSGRLEDDGADADDLPLDAQKVGITIWKMRDAGSADQGARLLTHPETAPVRLKADPTLAYGDKVRIGVESPRAGYLYVIDRELYDDGTMSDGYMIFPTARTRSGNNRIEKGSPIEIPALSDDPFYFEAKPVGLERNKRLAGEVLSVIITSRRLEGVGGLSGGPMKVSGEDLRRWESLYAGRVEVFELEGGVGQSYTPAEHAAAESSGGRLLTHGDVAPQTLYLVEDKKAGGLLVTVVLKYEVGDRALLVGVEDYRHAARAPGAVNDAYAMSRLLREQFGFTDDSIKILPDQQATAANIRQAFREWLIEGTKPGGRAFFFFAGHGSQVPDDDGDETVDGRDEVLAPHDVTIRFAARDWAVPASNFIRDDEINQWVAELAGRRVVMVFDSCHSGTISRAAGGGDYWRESRFLRAKESGEPTKDAGDLFSPHSGDPSAIKEQFLDRLVSGVVVISAAKPNQEAMPVRAGGTARGALSYLLTDRLRVNASFPLPQLESQLKSGMAALRQQGVLKPGRNGQYQEPVVEILSAAPLAMQQLFGGSWVAAPATALTNPLSPIKIALWPEGGKTVYRAGDLISFIVETNTAGYLYILVFSEQNVATCVFPNTRDRFNHVQPGTHRFPRNQTHDIVAQEPFGRDVWVALISDGPLNLADRGEGYSYTWQEVFALSGIPGLQQAIAAQARTRGAGVRVRPNNWQAATIVLETTPK